MAIRQISLPSIAAVMLAATLLSTLPATAAVKWRNNVDSAKIEATQTNRLVLLHFGTKTCGPCQKLERDVFTQPQVGDFMEQHFVPVKVDADQSPALSNAYKISRVPTDVVLTPQGNVVASLSCPMDPTAYATQLGNVSTHYKQYMAKSSAPVQPPVQSAYAGLQVGQYNAGRPVTTPGTSAAPVQQVSGTSTNPYFAQAPTQAAPAHAVPAVAGHPQSQASVPTSQAPVQAQPNPYGVMNPYAQPAHRAAAPAPVAQPVAAPQQNVAVPPQTSPQIATASPAITQAQTQPAKPSITLPAGSPPLAFDGFCPVTLKSERKWIKGDTTFGAVHRGRTFLFTNEGARQKFLANPDAYSPVFSGYDAVVMLEQSQAVEGSRKFGYEYRGAFYLFSSQDTMNKFASDPDRYSAQVRQAMNRLDGNLGTIRR